MSRAGRPAREEEAERERELSARDAAGDVVEQDARVLEGAHETHDVDVGRRKRPVLGRVEQPEILQPTYLVMGARDELRQLFRRDTGHGLTLGLQRRGMPRVDPLGCHRAISAAAGAATTLRQPAGPSLGSRSTEAPSPRARSAASCTSGTST